MLLNVEDYYAGENAIFSKVLLSYNTTNLNKAVFITLSQVLQDIHTTTVHFNVSTLAFKNQPFF